MPEKKVYNVGLIGCGTVGTGVIKNFENRPDPEIRITKIAVKNPNKKRDFNIENYILTNNVYEIINDPEIDIVVELIGGYKPAIKYILEAINKGKHIVTANKAIISEYPNVIFEQAKKNKVNVGFEASVGGGISIIDRLVNKRSSKTIDKIIGILNGTTNYILTKMDIEGLSYEDTLKEAQKKGYAEADPIFDISGKDAQQKLAIISSLAFNQFIHPNEIYCEGIEDIKLDYLKEANVLDYKIKLLAIARKNNSKLELRVHPALINKEHDLAKVSSADNGIYLEGSFGHHFIKGEGAGEGPTASAVTDDILDIVEKIKSKSLDEFDYYKNKKDLKEDIDNIETKWYVRVLSRDVANVLWRELKEFGNQNISIDELVQLKKFKDKENYIPDLITTYASDYKTIRNIVKGLNKLDCIKGNPFYLRIED